MRLLSRTLQNLGRLTPKWLPHGSAVGNRLLKPVYSTLYGSRWETVQVWPDVRLKLDPSDCVGGNLFFSPHLYDRREREFIRLLVPANGVFIDVGANIGAYSLWAAQHLSQWGVVLAIEADSQTYQVLRENASASTNRARCAIHLENIGVSDKEEQLVFYKNTHKNSGANSFYPADDSEPAGTLSLVPLMSVVRKHRLKKIDFMKIDIEGFELKVLGRFFADCERPENSELRPRHVLVEIEEGPRTREPQYTRELRKLFDDHGYVEVYAGKNSLYTSRTALRRQPLPETPLVTIVTPSYNTGAYLAETLRSVREQAYAHVEHIVLDSNSTDETLSVLAQVPSVKLIKGAPSGMCEKVNLGFSLAQGDIVAWLCADDIYLPGAIGKAVDALKKNPDAGLVYCNALQIDEHGSEICRVPSRPTQHHELVHEQDYIPLPTVFIRRQALEAVGPVDERLQLVSDWDLWIRISRIFPLLYVDDWWAAFRRRPGQLSDTFRFTAWLQGRRMASSHGAAFFQRRSLRYWCRSLFRAADIVRVRAFRAIHSRLRSVIGGAGRP